MFEQLNENSLWTDGASLQAHTVESATQAFFFNFFAFLSMYTISSNTIVMRNYIASETHTKLSEIDVTNHDTTASIKLAAHFKVITEQSAQRLLRLVDKIKAKQITSDDLQDEMIKKVLTELHYGTHLSSQPILKSALDDFMDGKINLPFVAYFFFKHWKKFETVNGEIADMYKKGHFSTTYSDFMTGRRKLKRGVPRHLIKNTTPLTVVFENGVVIDPSVVATTQAQAQAPAAAPVQPSVAATPAPTAAFRSNMSARAAQAQAQAQLQVNQQVRAAAQAQPQAHQTQAQAQAQAAAQAATQVPATAPTRPATSTANTVNTVAGTAKLKFGDRTAEQWRKFIWDDTKLIPEHVEQIDARDLGHVVAAVYELLIDRSTRIQEKYYKAVWDLPLDEKSREALRHCIAYDYLKAIQYVPDEYEVKGSLSESILTADVATSANMIVTLVAVDPNQAKSDERRRKLRVMANAVFQTNSPDVWDRYLNAHYSSKQRTAALYLKTLSEKDVKGSLMRNYMEYYKSSDTLKQVSNHFKVDVYNGAIEVIYDQNYSREHKDEFMLVNYLSSYFNVDIIFRPTTVANIIVGNLTGQRTAAQWANLIVKDGEFSQALVEREVDAQVRYEIINVAFDYMLTQIKDAEAVTKLLRSAEGLFDITLGRYGELVDKMLKKASEGDIELAIDIPYPDGVKSNKSVVNADRVVQLLSVMPLSKLFVKDSLESLRKLLKHMSYYPNFDFVLDEDKIAFNLVLKVASVGMKFALAALKDELVENKALPSDMSFNFDESVPVVDCGNIENGANKLIYDALVKVKSAGRLKFVLRYRNSQAFTITPGQRTAPEYEIWQDGKINPDFTPSCSYDESKFAIIEAWRASNPHTTHFNHIKVAGSEALIRSYFIERGFKTNIAGRDFMLRQAIDGFADIHNLNFASPKVSLSYDKEILNYLVDTAYDHLLDQMLNNKITHYVSHMSRCGASLNLIFNSEKFKNWGTIENMFAVPATDQVMYYTILARYFKHANRFDREKFARTFLDFVTVLSQDSRFSPYLKIQPSRSSQQPPVSVDVTNTTPVMRAWLVAITELYSETVGLYTEYDGKTIVPGFDGEPVLVDVTEKTLQFQDRPNFRMYKWPLDIENHILAKLKDDDFPLIAKSIGTLKPKSEIFNSRFWTEAKGIQGREARLNFIRVLLAMMPMQSDNIAMSVLILMSMAYENDKEASDLIKPVFDKQAKAITSGSDAPQQITAVMDTLSFFNYDRKEKLKKVFEFAPKDQIYPHDFIGELIEFNVCPTTDPFMESQAKAYIKEFDTDTLLQWNKFYTFMHLPEVEDIIVQGIKDQHLATKQLVNNTWYLTTATQVKPTKKFIDACLEAGMTVKNSQVGYSNAYNLKTYPKNLLESIFYAGRTIESDDEKFLSYYESMRVNFWLNSNVNDDHKVMGVDLIREEPNRASVNIAERNSHISKMTSFVYALGHSTKDEQLKLLDYCQIDAKHIREAFFKPELQMISAVAKNASNLHQKTMEWILNVLSSFLHSGPGSSQMRRTDWNEFFPKLNDTLKQFSDAGGNFKLKKTNKVPDLFSDNQAFLVRQQIAEQSTKYGLDISDLSDALLQVGMALNGVEFTANFDNVKTMSDLTSIVDAGQTAITLKEPFVSRLPVEDLPTRIKRGRDMTMGGFSGRHTNNVPLVLESYEVNKPGNKERVEAFRQSVGGEYARNFYHSCGTLAASFILRYGFKNVADPKLVVGKMLGDGLYVAKHVDKTIQYATNRNKYTNVGDVGYMIVFDVVFGKVSNDPNDIPKREYDTIMAPGVGTLSDIRTPEWCLRRAEDQAVYVAAHKVRVTHISELEKMAAENNVPWVE